MGTRSRGTTVFLGIVALLATVVWSFSGTRVGWVAGSVADSASGATSSVSPVGIVVALLQLGVVVSASSDRPGPSVVLAVSALVIAVLGVFGLAPWIPLGCAVLAASAVWYARSDAARRGVSPPVPDGA